MKKADDGHRLLALLVTESASSSGMHEQDKKNSKFVEAVEVVDDDKLPNQATLVAGSR